MHADARQARVFTGVTKLSSEGATAVTGVGIHAVDTHAQFARV